MLLGIILSVTGLTPLKRLTGKSQTIKVFLLSIIFCITIVLGNVSLKYIPISFNQAIGATTPFFTAIFAFFLQGIREIALTYATLIPIATGVVVASGGEPLFHLLGFFCCVLATAGRALKSVVQAIIMSDPSDKVDPMSLLLYMSTVSTFLLMPTTLLLEPQAFGLAVDMCNKNPGFIWWLAVNSAMAYLVNLTNFLVTKYTSALTLQVLGNAKGVIAAIISVLIFHNPVTWRGVVGYAITFCGVFLYSESKRRYKPAKVLSDAGPDPEANQEAVPLLKATNSPVLTDTHKRNAS